MVGFSVKVSFGVCEISIDSEIIVLSGVLEMSGSGKKNLITYIYFNFIRRVLCFITHPKIVT